MNAIRIYDNFSVFVNIHDLVMHMGQQYIMANNKEPVSSEFREKTVGYITAALGLVVGLAWNDAITSTINSVYPSGHGGLIAKFVYAVALTLVILLISIWLSRWASKRSS